MFPSCRLTLPTTLRERLTDLELTELLHEQVTTVFASGRLGSSNIRRDSTKSIPPTFCKPGLLNKSQATSFVCSCLLLDKQPSLSPSMSVWLPAPDILLVTITIGFLFNSPHSTFGPAILPPTLSNDSKCDCFYSHHQSPQTDHLHHWQSSEVMPEPQQRYVVFQFRHLVLSGEVWS